MERAGEHFRSLMLAAELMFTAQCSRHFWDEVALSRASLAALRYFVLEILPRHADSIRCLDMRLTACEHPNGVQDDLGKACTMTVGQAERRHGGTARNLRLYVGASVEEKLATMHGQRQVERVGLKAGYKCNGRRAPVKYRQAAAEASVQVKKQLERGERHNMFLEILKTVPQVEQVVMDIVPFALDDDAARHAGVAGELHDVLTDKAETLRSLEIRIKAPASFGREHLAETLRPLRHLEILTVFGQRSSGTDEDAPSDAQTTSSSRATLGEIISAMTDLVALELRDYDIIDDSWAHLTRSPILVWPLTALALVNVSHCTFDVIHAIIKGCSDTLQDLELKKTPPAPAAVEGAHGRNVGPAFNDSTAQIQTSDDVEFLSPANRSLATPLPACNDLDRLVIATDFHGSYLKLFEHCKSIKRLELEDCPRLAPGDVLAFLRVHPQVDDLDVTHGCNFYDMVGWHAVVDYCQREREILIHDISDFLYGAHLLAGPADNADVIASSSDDEDESE